MSDIITVSSAYAGSVRYYAAMLRANTVAFNDAESNLGSSWCYNHCRIIGANGVQALTIPIVKSSFSSETIIKDIKISSHGDWERIHWGAIFSAYGKSPFFEYIEYDLHRIYKNHSEWLVEFNEAIHALVIEFLDLPIISVRTQIPSNLSNTLCKLVGEKKPDALDINDVEYYQMWKDRHSFTPDLSIIDLLMNTGRESIFTLLEMAKNS